MILTDINTATHIYFHDTLWLLPRQHGYRLILFRITRHWVVSHIFFFLLDENLVRRLNFFRSRLLETIGYSVFVRSSGRFVVRCAPAHTVRPSTYSFSLVRCSMFRRLHAECIFVYFSSVTLTPSQSNLWASLLGHHFDNRTVAIRNNPNLW